MKKNKPGLLNRRTAILAAGAALPALPQSVKKDAGHPVVFFEIGCKDRAKTESFFGDLFGWKMQHQDFATPIDTGAAQLPGQIVALGHEPQHYTMFYVEVDDVKAYLDKAVSLGGKILVPPIKIPTGTFGWFADPEGNMIGLLKRA